MMQQVKYSKTARLGGMVNPHPSGRIRQPKIFGSAGRQVSAPRGVLQCSF